MPSRTTLGALVFVAACITADARQAAPAPSGHWTGAIEAGAAIPIEVDLERQGDSWRGTMSIPSQNAKGVPLADITVKDAAVTFTMKSVPGSPRFAGQLTPDGKTLAGTFTQGGGSVPLSLVWKGEAQFEKPIKNAAVSKAVLGSWEGALDVKGTTLRLIVNLVNGPDGATGTMISADQGNAEFPLSAIVEEGGRLKLTVNVISGSYDGEVKGDSISGTWTQGPASFPLVLKRRP
jgi:hypothetical protein